MAIQSALVDPNAVVDLVVGTSAEVRIEVIPISAILDVALNAVTPSVVIQIATVDFRNEADLSVVAQTAMADFPNVALSVVQVVSRAVVVQYVPDAETRCVPDAVIRCVLDAVIRCVRDAVIRCVQSAVYQCVADLDAMVVLQDEAPKVLPYDAPDVVPAPVLAQFAPDEVQSVADVAQVPQVFLFSAPAPGQPQVVQPCAAQAYCLPRVRCVAFVHPPDCVCYRDLDVRRAVDPVTPASRDGARSRSAPQVRDDLPHRLRAFLFLETPLC